MTRVLLVRHASHGLIGRALAGRMPGVSLTPEGRSEATRLAASFRGLAVTRLIASPLDRCRETAAPLAAETGRPVEIDDRLNELDCGDWTGKSFDALEGDPRWARWNTERDDAAIPGGETMGDVQRRVGALLDALADGEAERIVLVSHSDVIKAAVLRLLHAPLRLHDRLTIDPASVTAFDLWSGGGKLVAANDEAAR